MARGLWNPALDFMRGYQFTEGVQARREDRERLRTLQEREDILWDQRQEDRERLLWEQEMQGMHRMALASIMDPETGEYDLNRLNTLAQDPRFGPAFNAAMSEQAGRRVVATRFTANRNNPSEVVPVARFEDGSEDVLGEPGEDSQVMTAAWDNVPGYILMSMARYDPEGFERLRAELRAQSAGRDDAELWDAIGSMGQRRGLESALENVPAMGSAAPSGQAPVSEPPAGPRRTGLTSEEMAAEPPTQAPTPADDLRSEVRAQLGWEAVADDRFLQLIEGATPAQLQQFLAERGPELTDRQKDLATTALQQRANPPARGLTSALPQQGAFGSVIRGPADAPPGPERDLLAVRPQDLIEGAPPARAALPERPPQRTLDEATAQAIIDEPDPQRKLEMARAAGIPEDQIPEQLRMREGRPRPERAGDTEFVPTSIGDIQPGQRMTPRQTNQVTRQIGRDVPGGLPEEVNAAIRKQLLNGRMSLRDAVELRDALLAGPDLKWHTVNDRLIGTQGNQVVFERDFSDAAGGAMSYEDQQKLLGKELENRKKAFDLEKANIESQFPEDERPVAHAGLQIMDNLGILPSTGKWNAAMLNKIRSILKAQEDRWYTLRPYDRLADMPPEWFVKAAMVVETGLESIDELDDRIGAPVANLIEQHELPLSPTEVSLKASNVAAFMMREYGIGRDAAIELLRTEIAADPRALVAIAKKSPRVIASALAKRYAP